MKILLDNCVHYGAKTLFPGHEVFHCSDLNWREFENGKLLASAAEFGFAAFVTADKNIRHQNDLTRLPLPVVELNSFFTRINDLILLAPRFESALEASQQYRFVSVSRDGIECLAPI